MAQPELPGRNSSDRVFDPIAMEIFSNRLLTITEEMGITLVRGSFSPNIKERKDCSVALFDRHGRLVAQAAHIPMHLGALAGGVEAILARYKLSDLNEGDAFMCNDPYLAGGTHTPDITVVTPVFADGVVRFFATNIGHHSDVGGATPGSVSPTARTIFDEGLRIPLVRVKRSGTIDQDILGMVTANSREPEDREFDLKVQIAANDRGRQMVEDLVQQFGIEAVEQSVEDILDYTERRLRSRIAAVGDGIGTCITYLDDDGLGGEPVAMQATVCISADSLSIDFNGSGPQARGAYNMPEAGLKASVYYCVKTMLDPELMPNEGMFRAVSIKAPEGTITNPRFPAAVGMRSCTAQPLCGAIIGAFGQLLPPDRIMASSNDAMPALVVSGRSRRREGMYVYVETIGGGAGARAVTDGSDGTHVHITNSSNLPVEALENEYPLIVNEYALICDSGGAGEYRGGLGIARQISALEDDTFFYASSEKTRFAPEGVYAGQAGRRARIIRDFGTAGETDLAANQPGTPLRAGQSMRLETPGGGGYGSPMQRSPAAIRQDLVAGKVTRASIAADYGDDKLAEVDSLTDAS